MTDVVLIGGGGHAKVVLDSLMGEKRRVCGIFDEFKSGHLFEVPIIDAATFQQLTSAVVIIAIGDNASRKRLATKTKQSFTHTIHPSALVAGSVSIGEGSMILHGTILQPFVTVGKHTIANTGSRIDHDCSIGDYAHLAPGVVLCGQVSIGEGTLVGASAVVIPGIRIGRWAIIGAGAVVTKDVPDYAIAVGNPAKVIRFMENI